MGHDFKSIQPDIIAEFYCSKSLGIRAFINSKLPLDYSRHIYFFDLCKLLIRSNQKLYKNTEILLQYLLVHSDISMYSNKELQSRLYDSHYS